MKIDEQELAAVYRQSSDDDLAAMAADLDSLTDAARTALEAEIQRRGMSSGQLERLHAKELHREMRFDQMETVRRKRMLLHRLISDPKGWIWAALFVLGLVVFEWLRSRLH